MLAILDFGLRWTFNFCDEPLFLAIGWPRGAAGEPDRRALDDLQNRPTMNCQVCRWSNSEKYHFLISFDDKECESHLAFWRDLREN